MNWAEEDLQDERGRGVGQGGKAGVGLAGVLVAGDGGTSRRQSGAAGWEQAHL